MSEAPLFEAVLAGEPPDVVLHLVGELDADGIASLEAGVAQLAEHVGDRPVIDLDRLEFLGSAGLSALLRAQRTLPGLVLRGVNPTHQRVFEVAGVDALLRVERPRI